MFFILSVKWLCSSSFAFVLFLLLRFPSFCFKFVICYIQYASVIYVCVAVVLVLISIPMATICHHCWRCDCGCSCLSCAIVRLFVVGVFVSCFLRGIRKGYGWHMWRQSNYRKFLPTRSTFASLSIACLVVVSVCCCFCLLSYSGRH